MTGQSSWSPAAPISNPTAFGDIPPNRHMAAPKLLRDPPDAPPKRLQPKHRRNFVRRPHHFPPRDLSPRSSLYPVYHSHTPSSPLEGVQFSMAKGVHFYLSSDSKRIKEIAETRVRYGYRRIHVLLRREGWPVNVKRVCRLYREQGLQLRNKSPKRRVKAKLRDGRSPATEPNQVWAMDFVHDQLFDGRKIRVLTIVDAFTRFSPAIDVRQSYRGANVVETLERAAGEIGYPKTIRLDNGPEFISRELDLWAFMHDVTLDFSRPGKPTDNAFIESLNGKFRAECLNVHWFLSLSVAREDVRLM